VCRVRAISGPDAQHQALCGVCALTQRAQRLQGDDNTMWGVAPPAMPRRSPQGHSSQAAVVAGHAVAETAGPG